MNAEAERIFNLMRDRNFEEPLRLLREGVDINGFYFEETGTFLYKAIHESRYDVVKFLLDNSANPNRLYSGENALSFLRAGSRHDKLILEDLLAADVWMLPLNYEGKTILEHLESVHHTFEEERRVSQRELDEYLDSPSVDEEQSDYYEGMILFLERNMSYVDDMIRAVRPIAEANIIKLKIEVSGTDRVIEFPIDKRATVEALRIILSSFYFEDAIPFDIIYPRFRLQNKRAMEADRRLSDYGLQTGSKLSVVMRVSSERHWNAGGGKRKRKTQKRKTQKCKTQKKKRR